MNNRRKPPAAPAAYRPQPTPKVLQLKKASGPKAVETRLHGMAPSNGNQSRKQPAVYKPQTVPRVLQTKMAVAHHARPSNTSSPRIVRPGSIKPGVIQRAMELGVEMARMPDPENLPINALRSEIVRLRSTAVNERGFFYRRSPREIVDGLFARFVGLGFHYDLGNDMRAAVLGDDGHAAPLLPGQPVRTAFGGNCKAMAAAFAQIVNEAGISAEAQMVREEEPGRAFVAFCPHFIDPQVIGHIRKNGAIWNFHYLFTNHAAVWVPSLNRYYDPMGGTTYQTLNEVIEMELQAADATGNAYTGRYLGQDYLLTRTHEAMPGGFRRWNMVLLPDPADEPGGRLESKQEK